MTYYLLIEVQTLTFISYLIIYFSLYFSQWLVNDNWSTIATVYIRNTLLILLLWLIVLKGTQFIVLLNWIFLIFLMHSWYYYRLRNILRSTYIFIYIYSMMMMMSIVLTILHLVLLPWFQYILKLVLCVHVHSWKYLLHRSSLLNYFNQRLLMNINKSNIYTCIMR